MLVLLFVKTLANRGATPNDYDSDPIAQIVEWGAKVLCYAT